MKSRNVPDVGDLVRIKGDDVLGLVISLNVVAEPSFGPCWYVFWYEYRKILPEWEINLDIISKSICL